MDYGTDIKSEWEFNEDGDLKTISDIDNITQALVNRLNCELHSLDLFYENYGSLLSLFLGWKRNDSTLDFLKLELQNRLRDELRVESFNVNVEYMDGSNGIKVSIDLNPSTDYVHTVELELSESGVEEVGY